MVWATVIASQTTGYTTSLNSWRIIQELGTNLSGTVKTFTFRVSTSVANNQQFGSTALNSRIYDKTTGEYIIACLPTGSNGVLAGLTFSTTNVPSGYQDVTLDFSCRNYSFVNGHRYLVLISNANIPPGWIRFASATYSNTGNDYFTGGGLRYSFDNGTCNAASYVWNSSNASAFCNIFTHKNDDIYFVLENTDPSIEYPVIFIPGIGGSELKTNQDIIWNKDNGHGGTYSHAYAGGEKIWVNQDEAVKLGDDDYFDILKLKTDGVTSEADLGLTGNLTSFGYSDIDSFFSGLGYTKNTNFFVFPYDWRKDVRDTAPLLDTLVEQAKTASGKTKVNIVAHSMGGLVARNYISDPGKASKVNKLIELGVPHLGSVKSIKTIMYGDQVGPSYLLGLIALNKNEVKDVSQNSTSMFQLLPSIKYFDFYTNSDLTIPYPFRDDRDIDNNGVTSSLNYDQIKTLLNNLSYNQTTFGIAEQFHNSIDSSFSTSNGVTIYTIAGSNQPTLGQIHETWWLTWPTTLLSKRDKIFINGDGTVPLYSATLNSSSLNLSGAHKIYYTEQEHSNLVASNGTAMQTVKSILNEANPLPVEVKDQKITLEGRQISVDQNANIDLYDSSNNHTGLNSSGDVETNIANTFYDSLGDTKHIFVKKSASSVTVKVTSSSSTPINIKIRNYANDSVEKTILYKDVLITPSSTIQFTLDPTSTSAPALTIDTKTVTSTSEVSGTAALDQSPPVTTVTLSGTKDSLGIYSSSGATVTLSATDSESGVLKTEYSLDNGVTVKTYSEAFIFNIPGRNILLVKSTDKLGNEEKTQSVVIEVTTGGSSSSSTSSSSSSDSSSSNSTNQSSSINTVLENLADVKVLGASFENPIEPKTEIKSDDVLGIQSSDLNNFETQQITSNQALNIILLTSSGIVIIATMSLGATFIAGGTLTGTSLSGWLKGLLKIFS